MKKLLLALSTLVICSADARAQTVLAVDFADRAQDPAALTQAGFSSFLIASNISNGAIQTGTLARVFGALTVTVSGAGANPGYDDRLRGTPANSGAFDQSLLLRDFIFSQDQAAGGLNATIDGLTPDQVYQVTLWSFDVSTTGGRLSDWSANGSLVKDNYSFNGSAAPTSNQQYQIVFKVAATAGGQIAIQGRRESTSPAGFAVFLNALQVDVSTPDAPAIVGNPAPADIYAGDNAMFTVQAGGTAPFTYLWFLNETNLVATTAGATLLVSNATAAAAGNYSVIVSNATGTATSAPAALVVRTVTNIVTGLLAYWPLDVLTESTTDISGNNQTLFGTNMDAITNPVDGYRNNAMSFNGSITNFLIRTNGPGDSLPAYRNPAYTVALWVKGNYVGQSDRRVFSESSYLNNNPLMTIGTANGAGSGVVDIFIRNDNGVTPHNHKLSSLVAFDGNWHHIAWVDNNGFAQLYVDGVQDTNNFNYTRGVLTTYIDSLAVVYRTNAQALFTGLIDDTAIWKRSLTQSEVQYVMTNGAVLPRPQILSGTSDGTNVFLKFLSSIPNGPHFIEFTTNLSVVPIPWTEVPSPIFSVDGNTVTAQFPATDSDQGFYRIRE